MTKFPFSVWFLNLSLAPEDEDYEWVACMLIEAESADAALARGNGLARSYADRNPTAHFLRSTIEEPGSWAEIDASSVPTIPADREVSDDEIGW